MSEESKPPTKADYKAAMEQIEKIKNMTETEVQDLYQKSTHPRDLDVLHYGRAGDIFVTFISGASITLLVDTVLRFVPRGNIGHILTEFENILTHIHIFVYIGNNFQ